jgi:glycosyltransferase involved in cell wall biosynthesis
MRVAIVAAGPDMTGGQAVQAATLVAELRRDGHQVTFIPINPRFPARLRPLHRVRYARTLVNEALYLSSLRRLVDVDVVHIFSASYWSFALGPLPAILAARGLGKRAVLHYHSGEADDHLTRWGMLVHPWLRGVHAIVVPSEYLRTVFARHGYHARVIRNVVDTWRFRYRERRPLRPRLFCNRAFEPHYRVEDVLDAFSLIKTWYPETTLTLAGSGSAEVRLRGRAARLGGDSIRFVGAVSAASMADLYDDADVFINASVIDNQPVSLLEAFAAGVPVVSTATGDISAMVRDGETGLLVPQRDPEALAKAVEALLEDPDRTQRMTLRARAEVERYAWPFVRDQWAAVYTGRAT